VLTSTLVVRLKELYLCNVRDSDAISIVLFYDAVFRCRGRGFLTGYQDM
jgi:hypothetical protein